MENQIVEYSVTDSQIEVWKKMYTGLKIEGEGKDRKKSYNVVKDALTVIKDQRISVEKKRKELKSDALAWGKKVDGEAKRIKALLEPLEVELKATKQAEDNIEVERKAAEAKKEQEIADLIKCEIAHFDLMVVSAIGRYNDPSKEQEKSILNIIDYDIDGLFFMEFFPEMESKKETALRSLNDNFDKKVTQENEAEELKKQKEEQEKIAIKQAAAQKTISDNNASMEAEIEKAENELAAKKEAFEAEKLKNEIEILHLEALLMNSEFDKNKAIQGKEDAEKKAKLEKDEAKKEKELEEERLKSEKALKEAIALFEIQAAEPYLIDDFKCYESMYLSEESGIEDYFKDNGYEFFNCGQGHYQEESDILLKVLDKFYNVNICAEIGSSQQDRGDRLYFVEEITSVTYEETEKPLPKEKESYNYKITCSTDQKKFIEKFFSDNGLIFKLIQD